LEAVEAAQVPAVPAVAALVPAAVHWSKVD
jgi:hypothetical protein